MQQVTKGLVLLVAVAIDVITKTRYGFEQAAQFASWVKELCVPGSREKAIRTMPAGILFAAAGVIILGLGIYGFIQFPAADAITITFIFMQLLKTAILNRATVTVVGGLRIVTGIWLRHRTQFASWVKELLFPGSRAKPIRTHLFGAVLVAISILTLAAALLDLFVQAFTDRLTFINSLALAVVLALYRAPVLVLGALGTIIGLLVHRRKSAPHSERPPKTFKG